MPKKNKEKISQFIDYKKWTTNEGYTFFAKDKKDAKLYIEKAGLPLGSLQEVKALD
tara:strand:- start:23 stop:190 length:168 start_codon:yes stop_codon:yes gene_type:complete